MACQEQQSRSQIWARSMGSSQLPSSPRRISPLRRPSNIPTSAIGTAAAGLATSGFDLTGWVQSTASQSTAAARSCLQSNPCLVPLAAGAIAGATVEVTLFPIDCIKTRLQSTTSRALRLSGCRGLYRGVGVTAAGAMPSSALFFSTYEFTKGSLGSSILASVLGELVASTVRLPVDLVKQRMQAGVVSNFAEAARGLRATPGSVLWASFRISAARDIAHSGLQYPMYEHLKMMVAKRKGLKSADELPAWEAAQCGSTAGALSAVITTPLDLLRTRLNLRRADSAASNALTASSGRSMKTSQLVMAEASQIYQADGIRGFFRGGICRGAWMGLGGFVFLGSFEFMKQRLNGAHNDKC